MLKKRLIATLIIDKNVVVQSINYDLTNIIHSKPEIAIDYFNKWSIDEIIILNVSRDSGSKKIFLRTLKKISKKSFVPITAGGWVKNNNDIKNLLKNGADKVVINTNAFKNHTLIKLASKEFGAQCIIISIDVKKIKKKYKVFIDRGRLNTNTNLEDWIKKINNFNIGELYISSIDKDGTRQGYDYDLYKFVKTKTKKPIVAFGGLGEWSQIEKLFKLTNISAAAGANIYHYIENSATKAKEYLKSKKINLR